MEKTIITFSANEQKLIKTGGIECYASNIVSYIEAHFDLGANWSGYDSVRAVWSNDNNMSVISTVLDADGVCVVPFEVLKTKGIVKVNLVGSISVSDVLTDRLTTFPCEAVKVTAKAKIEGSETQPITPSQFEQFVAAVISEVEKVTGMTAQAETLPAGAQATARYENGILYLGIPQGIQGERGETGADGNGIASVVYNADYSLTLVFDNGEQFRTPPIRGERGPAGADGRDGTNGRDGADGVTPSLSVGTVTTLPSTEDAYVTRTGTDENPVFNFGIPQGPKGDTGEVTMSQLSALLPTDTASGSIASITDGQSIVPVKSLKVTLEPIQSGSGTPSPSNPRPISGHTECVTSVSGVNVWDEEWENVLINISNGSSTPYANVLGSKNFCPILPSTAYYATCGKTDGGSQNRYYLGLIFYDENKQYVSGGYYNNLVFTTPENARFFKITTNTSTVVYGGTYNHDISINYPSTDHDYHAYDGTTYTTTLGRTVYGGSLDVVSGELVVDRAMVDLSTLAWLTTSTQTSDGSQCHYADVSGMATDTANTGMTSDRFTLASGKYISTMVEGTMIRGGGKIYVATDADTISGQLCYPLATPQTYQLDPQTISLLHGNNNVWSDGSVEVIYNADVGLYIDKKLSNSGTRSLSMGLTKSATVEVETEETKTETEETKTETEPSETDTETR